MLLAALTITTSAFLLFVVQPMMGKFILPWFGGAPAVWTTCLLFFQSGLLIGYGYADLLVRFLSAPIRLFTHSLLVIVSLILLYTQPALLLDPGEGSSPNLFIFLYLGLSIGVPYITLCATAPLIQGVMGAKEDNQDVYKLYSLSNAASLIALLGYPIFFEPYLSKQNQLIAWSLGFLVFGALVLGFLFSFRKHTTHEMQVTENETKRYPAIPVFFLAAIGCTLLLASTNHICQNIASVPFLWVLPLSLYLISFIFAFAHSGNYGRNIYALIFFFSSLLLFYLEQQGLPQFLPLLISTLVVVFSGCMICHGELAALKPSSQLSTSYYLVMSAGSVGGSLFTALLAPTLFNTYLEFPLSIALCLLIAILGYLSRAEFLKSVVGKSLFSALFFVAALLALTSQESGTSSHSLFFRNFFGVMSTEEVNQDTPRYHFRRMKHGEVVHGVQFQDPTKRTLPTAYYGEASGIGEILTNYMKNEPRRIGAIGLGVGTVASYGQQSDFFAFYEINPLVKEIAENHFSFLNDSPATIEHRIGDARLILEREKEQGFDILLLDAFSGDSVPAHLLTKEAFLLYSKHLSPNGVIVVHVSNRYLDLISVVTTAAQELNYSVFFKRDRGVKTQAQKTTSYLILCKPELESDIMSTLSDAPKIEIQEGSERLWTDDFSSLFQVLKW